MSNTNRIQRVAIVGAGGRLGSHFAEELLKTGQHTVTALTRRGAAPRPDLPAGLRRAEVDYSDDGASLVAALVGQEFLVIAPVADDAVHRKLVAAAAVAGVPWVMPNAYGADIANAALRDEDLYGARALQRCEEVEAAGVAYIAMVCGFWYEWGLALGGEGFLAPRTPRGGGETEQGEGEEAKRDGVFPEPFEGFDIRARKVVFYDDGQTKINLSTWRQCGRAVAALLSLPVSGAQPSLEQWKNKPLYIASFRVSQRDVLDSIHRVLGTSDADWDIAYEPSEQRYRDALEEMRQGSRAAYPKAMCARVFYPDGGGDFESSRGLANEALGLPQEELDEATRTAVEMLESGWDPYA